MYLYLYNILKIEILQDDNIMKMKKSHHNYLYHQIDYESQL